MYNLKPAPPHFPDPPRPPSCIEEPSDCSCVAGSVLEASKIFLTIVCIVQSMRREEKRERPCSQQEMHLPAEIRKSQQQGEGTKAACELSVYTDS